MHNPELLLFIIIITPIIILLMNSQSRNQHNQSTLETVISNMFFKQKSEIKHMHTMCVVILKICIYLRDVLWPKQHNRGNIVPIIEPTRTVLGRA